VTPNKEKWDEEIRRRRITYLDKPKGKKSLWCAN